MLPSFLKRQKKKETNYYPPLFKEDGLFIENKEKKTPKTQSKNKQHQFSCHNCGSATGYQVSTHELVCRACGYSESIGQGNKHINEIPLDSALDKIRLKPLEKPNTEVTCQNCGACSEWDINNLSDLCPYCKIPIAKLDTENNRLQIEAIVPFSLPKDKAKNQLHQWLKKRWFAPNVLKQMQGHSKQFEGVYIPHWTFDSLTYTDYSGLRGENHVEYITQMRIVNGRPQTVQTPVTRIHWFPVSGQVRLIFDDILVLASMLIPKAIINRLRPWRLDLAKPYTPKYLAGLKAKYYQIDLEKAFQIAQKRIASDIDFAIRCDIGGDKQQIHQKNTRYQNSTYKLILLPIWYSSFEYKGKNYEIVINGQTGKVSGQYPKSPIKIGLTIMLGGIILSGLLWLWLNHSNQLSISTYGN